MFSSKVSLNPLLTILKNIKRLADAGNDAENNTKRLDQIRQTYIGYLDPVTLTTRPKLTLNRNNNDYFKTYLIPLAHLPQRGFRASEHLLRRAFEWFDKQVGNYLKKDTGNEGAAIGPIGRKHQ